MPRLDRKREIETRCLLIADKVVPQYRSGKRGYSCTGGMAKRWGAAFEGALLALGHDPEEGSPDYVHRTR